MGNGEWVIVGAASAAMPLIEALAGIPLEPSYAHLTVAQLG